MAKKTPTKQRTIAKPNVKTKAKPKAQLQTKTSRKTTATKKPIRKSPIPKSPTSKSATKQPIAKKAKPVARNSAKGFRVNEHIVYPSHGVGQIIEIAEQEIQGQRLDLFVVNFEREKMVLRVPIAKATQTNGMRKLADKRMFDKAMKTLRGRARIKRTMWSRRAQEYEAKINSGDLIAIAEVVRDLYRNDTQPEQSYSERQLYEAALDRMAREVAAIQKIGEAETILQLEDVLYHATIKTVPKPTEKIEEKIEENAAQPKL
ncbi:MAG: CarD family transcriptional regulator [Alphaproteobacteria bacterium]|nr:CarD family transcriptional regulator [Alphaproteobacteria bacterium]